jgi:hypothetical protein
MRTPNAATALSLLPVLKKESGTSIAASDNAPAAYHTARFFDNGYSARLSCVSPNQVKPAMDNAE